MHVCITSAGLPPSPPPAPWSSPLHPHPPPPPRHVHACARPGLKPAGMAPAWPDDAIPGEIVIPDIREKRREKYGNFWKGPERERVHERWIKVAPDLRARCSGATARLTLFFFTRKLEDLSILRLRNIEVLSHLPVSREMRVGPTLHRFFDSTVGGCAHIFIRITYFPFFKRSIPREHTTRTL